MKELFEKLRYLRQKIERLNGAIIDISESIGNLEVMESNGMPRSNRTQAANDTHDKLEKKLDLLSREYSKTVEEEQGMILELTDILLKAELESDIDETLRTYYLRPYYCKKEKRSKFHTYRTAATILYIDHTTVKRRIDTGCKAIEKILFNS